MPFSMSRRPHHAQINPKLPAELERIILKGLEKDRELRYQSASELLADLERLQRDLQQCNRKSRAPARRTLPHPGYALAGLAIAAVAATFVLSRPAAAERRRASAVRSTHELHGFRHEPGCFA